MILAAMLSIASVAAQAGEPCVVPQPSKLIRKPGEFVIDARTRIVADGDAAPIARALRDALAPATGFPLDVVTHGGGNTLRLSLEPNLVRLGEEGYDLDVLPDRVEVRAFAPAGLFYGAQTLRQLLPAAIFRKARVEGGAWSLPCVQIEDVPRFGWRGSHVDVVRHFMPKEYVLKHIDLMALHKLNVLHLHLTDDQGWRLEIRRYPKLTEIGAWRTDSMLSYDPPTYYGKPHGGFYTQDDIREIVAYAAARFIRVLPEIEMPGHSQAALASYPELGNAEKAPPVGVDWGVYGNVFNVEESTIEFLQNVLEEVLDLFPSTFIHVGGDEVPKDQWRNSRRVQERMHELGIATEEELQSWFIRRMDSWLTERGRRLVGWDEILEGGLAPGATVMSWRGMDGGIAAARAGHDVVMAPTSHTYFDYFQGIDREIEPRAIGGYLPLERVYSFEPVPPTLSPEEARRVLGAQAQLWSEYIPNTKHMEYMAFPRLCALSEVVWSPMARRDWPDFRRRLDTHLRRLEALDVNYRRDIADPPAAGEWRSGDVSEAWMVKDWDLGSAIGAPGDYRITFQYTSGACRLDIEWIEIVEGDAVVGRVEQEGRTGATDVRNAYVVRVPARNASLPITLRARVRADGGTDSNGRILVRTVNPR